MKAHNKGLKRENCELVTSIGEKTELVNFFLFLLEGKKIIIMSLGKTGKCNLAYTRRKGKKN